MQHYEAEFAVYKLLQRLVDALWRLECRFPLKSYVAWIRIEQLFNF